MGACPKTLLRRPPAVRLVELPTPTPAPVAQTPPEPLPPLSPEEKAARRVIARYRQRLDWAMHIPAFEPHFHDGLVAVGLPIPRRGIGLRALVDSLMLESKKDLLLWVLNHFRGLLSGEIALRLTENWGLDVKELNWLEADRTLSATRWAEFSGQLRLAVQSEHRNYKKAQSSLFQLHHELPERLSQRLVFDPAKRADARQEGCLGLLHAIDKVDDGETAFAGYAQQWVTRAIRNFLLGERFPVHVPVNLASSLLCASNRNVPGDAPLAHVGQSLLQPRLSLDAPVAPDARPIALADESSPGPRDLLNHDELLRIVENMISKLSDKQREVLVRRYGLGEGQEAETLVNIAQSIGISHQQVSMRERRALEKLGSILRPVFREMYG